MKLRIFLCILLSHSLYLRAPIVGQSGPQRSDTETASVTFSFLTVCDDCATQNGAAGDNRYFVDVPISNNPTPATSGGIADLNMEVRLKDNRLVYVIPFKSGTSPRAVWKSGGRVLQVFFVPASSTVPDSVRSTSPPRSAVSEGVAVGSSVGASDTLNSSPGTSAPPPPIPAPSAATVTVPVNKNQKGSTAVAAVDMSVPESPAFTVLGLTPQTVTRPTSPRQFATSLLNGVDNSGNFQSGLAMDFVPFLLIAGDQSTLMEYQMQYVTRLLSRTQFSFATTKGATEDDKSMRLALGLNVTLWDRGDPRTDEELMTCLSTMKLPNPPTQLEPELLDDPPSVEALKNFAEASKRYAADQARFQQEKQEAIEFNNAVSSRCREESRKRNWNRSSWTLAAAPSWISPTGQTKNFEWNGGGFWTSLAYGFENISGLKDRSQLILHARYRTREQVADPNLAGNFITQNSVFFGSRFRHGSPTFNGSFEYTFLRTRPRGADWDNSVRLSLGFERRISGDTWFTLALGGETGRADGRNNGFVLSSFKWAFSDRKDVPAPK